MSIRPHRFKGSVPQTVLTSDTSHKYGVPREPTFLSNLAINPGSHDSLSPRFDSLVEWLTEQKSQFNYYDQFIINNATQEWPNGRAAEGKVQGVRGTGVSGAGG